MTQFYPGRKVQSMASGSHNPNTIDYISAADGKHGACVYHVGRREPVDTSQEFLSCLLVPLAVSRVLQRAAHLQSCSWYTSLSV